MATVSVNLSPTVINTLATLRTTYGSTPMSGVIDLFYRASYIFSTNHPYYSSYSYPGSSLRFNFSDAGYTQYLGVAVSDPNAKNGTGSATSFEDVYPNNYRIAAAGKSYFNYTIPTTGAPGLVGTGSLLNVGVFQELRPTTSASYVPAVGNETITITGAINSNASSEFSGTVSSITTSAEKFINTSTVSGNFKVSGNGILIGQQLGTTNLSGTLSSYVVTYRDGSNASIVGVNASVTSSTIIDERMLSDPQNFPGDDQISVILPATVPTSWGIASGAGNDTITIQGGGVKLSVQAGEGNDSIYLNDSGHVVDGGTGTDTVVYNKGIANYTIQLGTNSYSVLDKTTKIIDSLSNVESIKFTDLTVNLTAQATARSAPAADLQRLIELYVAFFNRIPDADGLAYWTGQKAAGQSVNVIAETF